MAHSVAGSIVGQIESVFEGGPVAGLNDRQLLERFGASRDAAGDAAFAALMTRYGPMVLLQPGRKLGATVRISGKMAAGGPITVRLEPCGVAQARLVGPDGKPVTGQPRRVRVTMVVTSGPPVSSAEARAGALAADEDELSWLDPVNHGNGWIADAQGRIAWLALIPGATYRIIDGPQVRREFVVGPGEAVELGDVLIRNPPR